jgi:hypothetical protein
VLRPLDAAESGQPRQDLKLPVREPPGISQVLV